MTGAEVPYVELADRRDLTDAEWLEMRKRGIGGSDAAGIVGLSEYDTPLSIWAEKTGRADAPQDNEAMRFGRDMEEYIAKRFAEASGATVAESGRVLQSRKHPFMMANIDRWAHTDIGDAFAGLEIKGTSPYNRDKYADGAFPLRFYVQCVHYMAVTGAATWYLAVYIYGAELHIYRLTRNESVLSAPQPAWIERTVFVSQDEIDALIQAEGAFWEYVTTDTIPPVTGEASDAKLLGALLPESTGDGEDAEIDLSYMQDVFRQREELKEAAARMDKEVSLIDNTIRKELGEYAVGVLDGWRVTWRTPKNGGARRFRVTKVIKREEI